MSTNSIRCNGPRLNAPEYSRDTMAWLIGIIEEKRKVFKLGEEQLKGVRFNSNELVLLSIRSNASEDDVRVAPLSWVHAALEDCASRDYWYTFEKDYADVDEKEEHSWAGEEFGGEG